MTSRAASTAAETTTAPGGNPTPSVEPFNGSQQIGTLNMSIAEATDTRQTNAGRTAAPPSPAELGQIMADVVRQTGSTTAANRGPVWMARYNCPGWCVMDHAGADDEPGWHQGPTATVETPTKYVDVRPGKGRDVALAARITQTNEDPDVFGIETRLWVDVDCETLELNAEETDVLIARLEQFLPALRAMREQLVEIAKGDVPENAEAKAAWLAKPLVPVADRLDELCAAFHVRVVSADGPNSTHLTDGVLLSADVTGVRTFLVPPGQTSGTTLVQLRAALTAGARP